MAEHEDELKRIIVLSCSVFNITSCNSVLILQKVMAADNGVLVLLCVRNSLRERYLTMKGLSFGRVKSLHENIGSRAKLLPILQIKIF